MYTWFSCITFYGYLLFCLIWNLLHDQEIFHIIEPLNEDKKWYRDHRNFKLKRPDAEYWKLQNKSKFIKIESQEAEIALRVGKILIMSIMEKSWADLRSILEEVFMSEFWINFLVIPRSDYLKEMRKLLIVMQKSKVIYRVSKCKIWWKDLIRSQQQNGSKIWWESEDLYSTNSNVCESKKGEKFMG